MGKVEHKKRRNDWKAGAEYNGRRIARVMPSFKGMPGGALRAEARARHG